VTVYTNPGPIANVVTKTDVEDSWRNAIRDRVVNTFATAAERDTFYAGQGGPKAGQFCYVDNLSGLLGYAGPVCGWQPPWNVAWGEVATSFVTIDQGDHGNCADPDKVTDIAGATVSWTPLPNRIYRTTFSFRFEYGNDLPESEVDTILTDNPGDVLLLKPMWVPGILDGTDVRLVLLERGLEGPQTRRLKVRFTANGFTSAPSQGYGWTVSSSTRLTQMVVEDIGPNGPPS
jgi:hypothetical protein